jgi:phosphatidate cytidylyltransferase
MNETLKRLISGAIYILLLLSSILFSTESFLLIFGVFLIIAVFEYCNLMRLNKTFPLLIAISVYTLITLICFYSKETQNYLIESFGYRINLLSITSILNAALLIITIIVFIKAILFLFNDKIQSITISSKYLYLLGYIILPFVFITKISYGENSYNPKIIISVFILIWTNDTFAYLVGKSIGRHKLFERVSPKKTIEGFLGGIIFANIAAFLISKFYIRANPEFSQKSIAIWITIALIVGIFGSIGDLIESKFKRIACVKDSGNIMPGHGGILDRLDSIIFVAPIVYLFYQILYYVS